MFELKDYPEGPGVYLMYGALKRVLYVGKAKNIKQRLRQYFSGHDERTMIPFLVSQIINIETVVVQSEKEALLLESQLIKKFQPKYNVLLKDDKSEIVFALQTGKKYPKVELIRSKDQKKRVEKQEKTLFFGPYPYAYEARKMLDLVHQIFPLRQCTDGEFKRRVRPCILYDMKQCLAPCMAKCTEKEYQGVVEETASFLKGKVEGVLKKLYEKMERCSENLDFERAQDIYESIQAIEKMRDKNQGGLFPEKSVGVLTLFRREDRGVITYLRVDKGNLEKIEHELVQNIWEEDFSILSSYLLQKAAEEKTFPKEMYINSGNSFDLKNLQDIYLEEFKSKTSFFNPEKGEKKELIEFALKNGEAFLKREKEDKGVLEKILGEMQEKLQLQNFPAKIECIDQSHFSGEGMVSSLVFFRMGLKDTSAYRRYKLDGVKGGDDIGGLSYVLQKRFLTKEKEWPDLLVVDGGKGQLYATLEVLKNLNVVNVDVISLAKEKGRHDKGLTKETIYSLSCIEGYSLEAHSPLLHFLQKVRDEAHRFAITYQKNLRKKKLKKSILDDIPGIGAKKKQALLVFFGSPQRVLEASREDLLKIECLNKKDIETIQSFLA